MLVMGSWGKVASLVPRYSPDISVYLHENVILGQMLHKVSCKQFLSMKEVVDMNVVGGMAGGTQVVGMVRLGLIIMTS